MVANTGGNVGIGTTAPLSKLTVAGTIETLFGGVRFPDASVQTTAGVTGIAPGSGLAGGGGAGNLTISIATEGVQTAMIANNAVTSAKIALPLSLIGSLPFPIIRSENTGADPNSRGVLGISANAEGVVGFGNGPVGAFSPGMYAVSQNSVGIQAQAFGPVTAFSPGVFATSVNSPGVSARSDNNIGLRGLGNGAAGTNSLLGFSASARTTPVSEARATVPPEPSRRASLALAQIVTE